METVLSIVLMVLIWLVPAVIKAKKEKIKKASTPISRAEQDEDELLEYDAQEIGSEFQNPATYTPNSQEYFTYETDDGNDDNRSFQQQSTVNNRVQTPEIEEEHPVDLTFDKDEIMKGVIFSEILKRKVN